MEEMEDKEAVQGSGFSSFVRRETQSGYRCSPQLNMSSSEESNTSDEEDSLIWRSKRQRHSRQLAACGDNKPFFNPNKETLNSPPRPVRMSAKNGAGAFKRNNIWGAVIQEQCVTEGLNRRINVDRGDDSESEGSDNVESYNYKMARKDFRPRRESSDEECKQEDNIHTAVEKETFGNESRKPRKRPRSHKSRGNVKERLGQRTWDKEKARPHITVTSEDSAEDIVDCLCDLLNEPKEDLMTQVVKVLGSQKALELLYITEDTEQAGGLMTLDGRRRRTPGGTYLQLMRTDPDVTQEQVREVFRNERKNFQKQQKEKRKRQKERKARQLAEAQAGKDVMDAMDAEMGIDAYRAQDCREGELASGDKQKEEILDISKSPKTAEASVVHKKEQTSDLEEGEIEDGEIPD